MSTRRVTRDYFRDHTSEVMAWALEPGGVIVVDANGRACAYLSVPGAPPPDQCCIDARTAAIRECATLTRKMAMKLDGDIGPDIAILFTDLAVELDALAAKERV